MRKVKRYNLVGEFNYYMDLQIDGDYIRYDDYKKLEAELSELKRKIAEGELVPITVYDEYYESGEHLNIPFEDFAKQKAGETK